MNKRRKLSRISYDKLKSTGMMWELYPEWTGSYKVDVLGIPEEPLTLYNDAEEQTLSNFDKMFPEDKNNPK